MPIYIIGAGAIGKALAVFLKLAGREIKLLRATADTQPYRQHYKVSMPDGTVQEADIDIAAVNSLLSFDGVVVLANKSFGNDQLAETLQNKTGDSPIVLLQNGLGIEQPFIARGFPQVLRCVLFVTSQSIGDDAVRFKPVTVCPIGIECGGAGLLEDTVRQLSTPFFPFRVEPAIQPVIWEKAIANSVFNSVCPLLGADNGIFHRNPDALAIARRIISECVAVAHARGVGLAADQVEQTLLRISRLSDGQLISTLQDIRNGRPTEIGTLNLAIAGIADQLAMSDTVRETRLLGELTRIKADSHGM